MRILWLNHYAPWPPHSGGKIRTTNLIRRLAAEGDEIEVCCVTAERESMPEPALKGVHVRFYPQRPRHSVPEKVAAAVSPLPTFAWVQRSREVLGHLRERAGDFDVAVVDHAHSGSLAPELEAARLPWLFDAANVEHSVLRQISRSIANPVTRARFTLDAIKFRRLESHLVERASASVAVSADDARSLEALRPGSHVIVHQSGVDLSYFNFVDHSRPRGPHLVMTGTLAYFPNLDASRWLIDDIMPRVRSRLPDATLTLVGGPVPPELSALDPATGVKVAGAVPDVRPYLREADLFVIPLRIGGGIRLKALEALASGLPIVATPLAVEGVGIVEHDLGILATTPDEFAAGIERGLMDTSLRSRLVLEGRRHVEANFDWDQIAIAFRSTLQGIAR